jgi:hypothetical protein
MEMFSGWGITDCSAVQWQAAAVIWNEGEEMKEMERRKVTRKLEAGEENEVKETSRRRGR